MSLTRVNGLWNGCNREEEDHEQEWLEKKGDEPWYYPTRLHCKSPGNRENIKGQIRESFRSMPPFIELTDEDVEVIIDYLQAL